MNTKMTATLAVAIVAVMVFAAVGSTTYSWFSDSEETDVTITTATVDISGVFSVDGNLTVNGSDISSMTYPPVVSISGNNINITKALDKLNVPLKYVVTNSSSTDAFWRMYTDLPVGWKISDVKIDGVSTSTINTDMIYLAGSDTSGVDLGITTTVTFNLSANGISSSSSYAFSFVSEAYQFGYNYSAPIDMVAGSATIGNVSGQDVKVDGMTLASSGSSLPIVMEFDQNTNDVIKNKTLEVKSSDSVTANTIQIDSGSGIVVLDITLGSSSAEVDLGGYVIVSVTIPGNVPNAAVYYNDGSEAIPVEVVDIKATDAGTTVSFKTNHFSEYVIVESEFEAIVDGTYYTTLVEAVENADNDTIVLLNDVILKDTLKIAKGKVIELDLNGKSISQVKECTAHYTMIDNYGDLTISGNGLISFTDVGKGDPNFGWGSYTISNHYKLIVENGTILNNSKQNPGNGVSNVHMYCAIQQGSGAISVTINDGKISTPTYRSLRANAGAVNINGGVFEGQIWLQPNQGNVTMNVTGGEFSPRGNDGSSIFMENVRENYTVTSASISGGLFNTKIGASNASLDGVKGCISGGLFTEVAKDGINTDLLVDGGKFVKDGAYFGLAVVIDVDSEEDLKDALTGAGMAGAGDTQISINRDLDMKNIDWTPVKIDGYHGADIVTVYGNGHTISNLSAALFAGGFAGGSGIIIKDLTIADSQMIADNTQGYGAFVCCADSMDIIMLTNCHLVNSSIITPNDGADESRIGGLIGWTAGYNNVNDGPVDSYIIVDGCSVVNCTLKGAGSIGGIVGHAGANQATYTTIEDCKVERCTLTSTDNGDWRVGVIIGTANNGQAEILNATSNGNEISQTGKSAPEGQSDLYGRFVPSGTGTLKIDGVSI